MTEGTTTKFKWDRLTIGESPEPGSDYVRVTVRCGAPFNQCGHPHGQMLFPSEQILAGLALLVHGLRPGAEAVEDWEQVPKGWLDRLKAVVGPVLAVASELSTDPRMGAVREQLRNGGADG